MFKKIKMELVNKEKEVICLKCNQKNPENIDRCMECSFPLRNIELLKIIPMEFLKGGEKNGKFC